MENRRSRAAVTPSLPTRDEAVRDTRESDPRFHRTAAWVGEGGCVGSCDMAKRGFVIVT